MNNLKRSYSSPKGGGGGGGAVSGGTSSLGNRYTSKPAKEASKLINPRYKPVELNMPETSEAGHASLFPIIKQADNGRLLPRHTAVLTRTAEDGVTMEDLDQLQQDLEKLLSTSAVRHRLLRSEIESIDRVEERRKNKRGRPFDKQAPLKRKRPDERSRYKDARNGGRLIKAKHNLPMNSFVNDLPVKREVPKVSFTKNNTSDKFWLSIEPYCADVNKDDVVFLDDLIQECSQDIDVKIPEVGDHYSVEWSDDVLGHERSLSNAQRFAKTRAVNFSNELKRNGLNAMVDTFSSPLTQRLLAALIEEKVVTKMPIINDKLKPSDFCLATKGGPRNGVCMDRRLKKELVEQGILDVEDLQQSIPPDDEILMEIKKCMQELKVVNEKNVSQLNQLRTVVAKDLRRQEVKEALDKVDNQVMEMYNKILITKQKQTPQSDEDAYDKMASPKHNLGEYEEEANKIIQQQAILHKELTELTNATNLL